MAVERKAKGKGIVEFLGEIFNAWAEYLEANLKGLFIDMLKISALGLGAVVAGAIPIGVLLLLALYPGLSAAKSFSEAMSGSFALAAVLLSVLIVIVLSAVSVAINSVRYNAVQERAKGRQIHIIPQAKANLAPVVLFTLLQILMMFVLILPVILMLIIPLFLNAEGVKAGLPLLGILLLALGIIAGAVLLFFIQFGWWELLINKKDPVEALKASFTLIRNRNILKTFAFDVCLMAIVLGLSLVIGILNYAVQILFGILAVVLPFAGSIGLIVVSIVLSVAGGAILNALYMPLIYVFWKKLHGARKNNFT